jgi:hypothetical protein
MKAQKSIALGLGFILLASLAGCEGTFHVGLAISQSFVPAGGTGKILISVVNPPDAKTLQIGPTGKFTFNPAVISVTSIKGVNGFQIFASTINNIAGEVMFVAGFPGGSIRPVISMGIGTVQFEIIEIQVQAIGAAGSSSALSITTVDVFTDQHGKDIFITNIQAGQVQIQ